MQPPETPPTQIQKAGCLPEEGEPTADELLPRIVRALSPEFGVFESLYRMPHHSDELQFAHFSGELADIQPLSDGHFVHANPSGFALSLDLALIKCIGEGLERHSVQIYRQSDFSVATLRDLAGQVALDPATVVAFSERQRQQSPQVRLSSTKAHSWTSAVQLFTGEPILVPAQLIYLSYTFLPDEPVITFPITTGAAGGGTTAAAIARSIYEIIERDAFMIAYLTKLHVPRVDLARLDHAPTQALLRSLDRYHLEPFVFDITLDLPVPTFMAVVIDRTGIGPAVSVGLKSHLHPYEALYGALLESQHPRGWIRREAAKLGKINRRPTRPIITLAQRGLAWYPTSRIKHLNFWLSQHPTPFRWTEHDEILSDKAQVLRLVEVLRDARMRVIVKDITPAHLEPLPYRVIKTLIPELQPLYLDERYPYLGGRRLTSVPAALGLQSARTTSVLNRMPHPFL